MSHTTHKRLVSACCGMELCWLCAWADFMAVATTQIQFPLAWFCAAFFMALFLSSFFKAKGYRLIWLLLAHVLGLGLMTGAALWKVIGWALPQSFYEGYQMVLLAAMICLFWYKGLKLSFRQMSYKTICNYFDLGISLLFSLLMIKLLIQIKADILISGAFTLYLVCAYFFFGLAAIFLSQNTAIRKKQYLKGFRVYGGLISGILVLLFCVMAVFFVLFPYMTFFAESGYAVLKQAAGPLSPYLIAILRFIFAPRNHRGGDPVSSQNQNILDPGIPLAQAQPGWAGNLFFSAILVLFFLICLALIAYLGYKLFKFLMSKQPASSLDKEETMLFFRLIRWLAALFRSFKAALLSFNRKIEDAKKGFITLVSWGKKSGMPKLQNETPAEYAARLGQAFEPLKNEIFTIVHAFHLETYGEVGLDPAGIFQMTAALKTIHSPLFWPMRINVFWKRL